MLNWFMAYFHCRLGLPKSAVMLRSASQSSLVAASCFDSFAQLCIDALDGVGRVDYPDQRRGKPEERDDPVPRSPPGRDPGREAPSELCSKAVSSCSAAPALAAV